MTEFILDPRVVQQTAEHRYPLLFATISGAYFRYQSGVMALIEATPTDYHLKGQFKIKTKNSESWPHPVVLDGKLYLRDQQHLHCYNVKKG